LILGRLWKSRKRKTFDTSSYDRLFEDKNILILSKANAGDKCIVSFSGVGHGIGGVDLQRPEFHSGGAFGSQIFVIDKNRSWGNAIEWTRLQDIVLKFAGDQGVVCIGNSMGGFLAVLGSRPLHATHVAAFAPQWSVDPRIVPDEHRWDQYVNAIKSFRYSDLRESFAENTRYSIVFGDDPEDSRHHELFHRFTSFAENGNIDILTVHGAGHDVAKTLKKNSILHSLVFDCLATGLDDSTLQQLGCDFSISHRRVIE